jgi:hypothetical protein
MWTIERLTNGATAQPICRTWDNNLGVIDFLF